MKRSLLHRTAMLLCVLAMLPGAVVAATRSDKKRLGAAVPYVVVDRPGELRWGQPFDDAAVLAAVEELR